MADGHAAKRASARVALTISLFATLLIPTFPTAAGAQVTPAAKIVFARNPGSPGGGIFVVNPDGTGETMINGFGDNPTWSPDGSRIAFDVNGDLYVMNADGTNRANVTNSDGSNEVFPDWSPDGTKLVFSGTSDGDFFGAYDLYTMNVDGTNKVNLTNSTTTENRPDWSEDGTQITFETQAGGSDFEIYTINADGTNLQAVTNNSVPDRDPNWSSQDEIAWGYNDLEIHVANSDGTNEHAVTNATDDQSPSWSADGNALVFSSSREGSYDLFILSGGVVTRVTTAPEHDLRADFFGDFGSIVTQHQLDVSLAGTGTGDVTSAPAGIACPSTCAADFDEDGEVILTADPDPGSEFTGWSGDCTGADLECTVTMDADNSVTATFAPAEHTLSVLLGGSGTGSVMSDDPGISCGIDCTHDYAHGTPVTLTAAPTGGATFGGWTGACGGSSSTCVVTMDQDRSVGATFVAAGPSPDPTPTSSTLTVFKFGSAPGSLRVSPGNHECSSSCTYTYPNGSPVSITAEPGEAGKYTWTGCESVTGPTCTTTLAGDRSVSAEFARMTIEEFTRDAQARGKTCLEIGDDIARIYSSTPTAIARALNALGCTVLEVSEFLQSRAGMSFERAATMLRNVGYTAADIAQAGLEFFRVAPREVGGVLKGLGYGATAIGRALREGGQATAETVGRVLVALDFGISSVAGTLRSVFNLEGGGIARLFVELGLTPTKIAKALGDVFTGASIGGIGRWLRDAGLGAAEIGRALKNGLGAAASSVASVLQNIGFDEFEIGGVLKNVFSKGPADVGRLLKGLGYGAGEIASVLKDRLGLAAERVADVLYNGMGYAAETVGRAVRSSFNVGINRVANIFEEIGVGAGTVARALGDIFNAGASGVASAMRDAGYGIVELARALKNNFDLGYNALYNLLRSVGFSISAVVDALADLF